MMQTPEEPRRATADLETLCQTGAAPHYQPAVTTPETEHGSEEEDLLPELRHVGLDQGDAHRFTVVGLIGRGGGGSVYEVFDQHLQRRVAVKVLRQRQGRRRHQHQQRFLHEAQISARLDHPGIVPVYDLDRCTDGRPWFAMRMVQGTALADLLAQDKIKGPSPHLDSLDKRLAILLRVCETMAYAHDQGIVHQDIKPGNIVIGNYGEVLLIDWGTAVSLDEITAGGHALMGTPMYMSPEQALRSGIDQRSDVYCIGATAWHLFSGRHPICTSDTDQFWARKRSGVVDPLPSAIHRELPEGLRLILEQALAPDPAQRPPDAGALLQALQDWQGQRANELLLERAHHDLSRAQAHPEHRLFLAIIEDCRAAQQRGMASAHLDALLLQARRDHARFALTRGETNLATSIIEDDPPLTDLQADLALARRRQHRLRRRAAGSSIFGLISLVMLALLGWFLYEDHQARLSSWQPVVSVDFTTATQMPELIETVPDPGDGMVQMVDEGLLLEKGLCWIRGIDITGPLRIRLSATWPEQIDGLEINTHVDRQHALDQRAIFDGYTAQFGGWRGRQHLIALNRNQQAGIPHTIPAQLVPGRRFELTYIVDRDDMRLLVDGSTVLQRAFLVPPEPKQNSKIALRSWQAPIIIHSFSIERRSHRARSNALAIGDSLLKTGHRADALRVYRDIIADDRLAEFHPQALARSILCLSTSDGSEPPAEIEQYYAQLRAHYPDHPATNAASLLLMRQRWVQGEQQRALDLAEQLIARQIGVVDELLQAAVLRSPDDPPLAAAFLSLLVRAEPDRRMLDLSRIQLHDISPLAGLAIEHLALQQTGLTSIAPLAGMPLDYLDISENQVSDLSPLRGIGLSTLIIRGCPISDCQALTGMPLRLFDCRSTKITDITPLTGAPIERLTANDCRLQSLEALRGAPLQRLSLDGSASPEVAILGDLPLTILHINNHPALPLEQIISDSLRSLNATGCNIENIEALAGRPLRTIVLRNNKIQDLTPLVSCQQLRSLNLARNRIERLPALPQRLTTLQLADNRLHDISSLAGMRIAQLLSLNHNPITDLRPIWSLATLPQRLECYPLTNQLPPTHYAALERQAAALEQAPKRLKQELAILAALLTENEETLLDLTQRIGDRYYLTIGSVRITLEETRQWAAAVGAELPRLDDWEDLSALQTMVTLGCDIWLADQPSQFLSDTGQVISMNHHAFPGSHWSLIDIPYFRHTAAPVTDDIGRNVVLTWPVGPMRQSAVRRP